MKIIKTAVLAAVWFAQSLWAAVNVNTADAEAIAAELNGSGWKKAQAIVAYREANGPFKNIEQLAEVKGIGLKTVEKNRTAIKLSE